MQTANGVGKAARVQLDRVEINGITVRDVAAVVVVADEALSTNLLGMTFLSRIKWTHDRGKLVLEQ
jgi:aspartyl protease family protein